MNITTWVGGYCIWVYGLPLDVRARRRGKVASRPVVLIGGGEHARVLVDVIRSQPDGFTIRGFVDSAECVELVRVHGVARLGDDTALSKHSDALAVLGVGQVSGHDVRRCIVERLSKLVSGWATLVHSRAWVSDTAVIAPGAAIMAGAVIQVGASVGPFCIVNSGAIIEHDVTLQAFVSVAPGAVVGGGCHIEEGATVGLGAAVRDHVRIGRSAMVAMGAVVVADLPPEGIAKGLYKGSRP